MKKRLEFLRRRWCFRRGHPMASWSPVVFSHQGPDLRDLDGTIIEGERIETRAWRCERHDKQPT